MLKRLIIGALVVASSLTTGCLQRETSHTLYLAPDGSVEWVTSETNVRSDEAEVGKRLIEEQTIRRGVAGHTRRRRGLRPDPEPCGHDGRSRATIPGSDERTIDSVDRPTLPFTQAQVGRATLVRGADENTPRVRSTSVVRRRDETAVSQPRQHRASENRADGGRLAPSLALM